MNELEDLKKLLEETKNKGFPEVIAIHPEVYNYWMHDKRTTKEIKEEVLKPKAEITLEEAKEIAEFPEPEQRKEIIRLKKQVKKAGKSIIEQKKNIVKGKTKPSTKIINMDEKFLKVWRNIAQEITIKMRAGPKKGKETSLAEEGKCTPQFLRKSGSS